jgi:hypothetical protein
MPCGHTVSPSQNSSKISIIKGVRPSGQDAEQPGPSGAETVPGNPAVPVCVSLNSIFSPRKSSDNAGEAVLPEPETDLFFQLPPFHAIDRNPFFLTFFRIFSVLKGFFRFFPEICSQFPFFSACTPSFFMIKVVITFTSEKFWCEYSFISQEYHNNIV